MRGPGVGRLAPGRRERQRAALLAVVANLVWPAQAALVAFALGGLLTGADIAPAFEAVGFAALGPVRAILGVNAEALAEVAALRVVRKARAQIVDVEARRAADSPFGGAAGIAALAGEKLDLLAPYVSHYAPARRHA